MTERKTRKRAFTKLRKCRSWPQAELRLKEGQTPYVVAEFIQSQHEYEDIKTASLARQIARFKNEILDTSRQLAASYIDKQIANIDLTSINDVDEMTKLILVQKDRIGKALQLEQKMPTIMKVILPEIKALFEMLEKRTRLLSDLGVIPKAPDKFVGMMIGDQTMAKVYEFLPDDQRARLREMIQGSYRQAIGEESGAESRAVVRSN